VRTGVRIQESGAKLGGKFRIEGRAKLTAEELDAQTGAEA
jgi:hypothetical protein